MHALRRAVIAGDLAVGALLALLTALLFAPAFVAAGSEFDEGILVAFPTHRRPASFYVELDPPASKRGSGLARELAYANVLLLGRGWNRKTERNGSRRFGSAAPNLVVRRRFCRRAAFGGYEVLMRCRGGRVG